MNPAKKLILIITALLSSMTFMSSCSKNTEAPKAAKAAKASESKQKAVGKTATKKEKASQAANATTVFSDGKNSVNVARDGQYVTLNWQLDATNGKIQKIAILRSATGIAQRTRVAELDPQAATFKDSLPDANAYWYWVRAFTADGKTLDFGPAKVEPDKAGDSYYIDIAGKYKVSVTRTLDMATLAWDFPAGEYKEINIVRNKRPIANPFSSVPTPLLTTLSWKSQSTDPLPEPNSDYWYSFQIILKSGAIVYKGPIKADYVSGSTKKASKK